MERYLIDTNIVSDYLSSLLPQKGMKFMDRVIDGIPQISIISQIELLCWNTPDQNKISHVNNFVLDCNIHTITPDVISNCVIIRKGKKIKMPDAIIGATALAHGFVLITNNEKDFKHIQGLTIINPATM